MIRTILTPIAAALVIAAALPETKPTTAAKPTPSPTTMNCLLASNMFAQRSADQQHKELAHQSLLFYLGRLDPRLTPPQLASALKQSAGALNGVNAASLMNECLVDLRGKAALFDTVVQQLRQQQK